MRIKSNSLCGIIVIVYFLINIISILASKWIELSSSLILVLNFILLLILFITDRKILKNNSNIVLLICLTLIISLVSVIYNDSGIGSLLNLLNFFNGFLLFSNIKINVFYKKIIMLISFILLIYLFSISFNVWNDYLVRKNILNPNSVGVFILLSYCLLDLYFNSKPNKSKSISLILKFAIIIISFIGILNSECRSALVGFFTYILINNLNLLKKFVNKNKNMILLILVVLGILFPIIYLNMYNNNVIFNLPFSDKSLYTGREALWDYMIDDLSTSPSKTLLGVGTNHMTGIGIINNFHNWYIGVLYSFGLISFVLYYSIIFKTINKSKNKKANIVLISIFIVGFFESTFLWTTFQAFLFMTLLISNGLEVKNNEM